MSIKITLGELRTALPVLSSIAKTPLAPVAAARLAYLMTAVDKHIDFFEDLRMAKLESVADHNEDGSIKTREVVDDAGVTHQTAIYKSPEAENEMGAFVEELLAREVELPYRIQPEYLLRPDKSNYGGYNPTPEELKQLGKLMSYKNLPKEEE